MISKRYPPHTRLGARGLMSAAKRGAVGLRVRVLRLLNGLGMGAGTDRELNRFCVACRFLCGNGIEIGALAAPLPLPRGARVRYVDRLTATELRAQYPELAGAHFAEPDVADDGERLTSFSDASLDFVVANHFVEHCEDPIGALGSFMRVLRPGGVAYLAVPNRRRTFDRSRAATTIEHLVADHEAGPARSRRAHFQEFAAAMREVADDRRFAGTIHWMADAEVLESINYSIHFHTWDPEEFLTFLLFVRGRYVEPFEFACALANGMETIVVLRRAARLVSGYPQQTRVPQA